MRGADALGRPASGKSVPQPGLRRLNLVVVTIDTLRADRLAQQGVLFENVVCQAPLTAPSHASIFTGLYPTVPLKSHSFAPREDSA